MAIWKFIIEKFKVMVKGKVKVKVTWWVQQPVESPPYRHPYTTAYGSCSYRLKNGGLTIGRAW